MQAGASPCLGAHSSGCIQIHSQSLSIDGVCTISTQMGGISCLEKTKFCVFLLNLFGFLKGLSSLWSYPKLVDCMLALPLSFRLMGACLCMKIINVGCRLSGSFSCHDGPAIEEVRRALQPPLLLHMDWQAIWRNNASENLPRADVPPVCFCSSSR